MSELALTNEQPLALPLGPAEARRLTDEFKRDAQTLWESLCRLYEGEAHTALGYSSWHAYCEEEFGLGKSRSYQLLDAGRVLDAVGPGSTMVERQARELVPLLNDEAELAGVWRDLRAEHGERLTAAKVRLAVDERLRREKVIGALTSSDTYEWYTPARYVDAAREVLGGIDLDPASSALANQTVKASVYYDLERDGLAQEWHGRVFMNPPYGRGLTERFVGKLTGEYEAGRVTAAVALLNGYGFDSSWFRPLWNGRLCFTNHRIGFTSPTRPAGGGPSFGSAFAYLGPDRARFARVFRRFGYVVELCPEVQDPVKTTRSATPSE